MSTEPMSEQDILNQINDVDLSKVETSFPLLASGLAPANITKCQWDKSEKDGKTNVFLDVGYALSQPHKTVAHEGAEAKTINPGDRGSTMSERIYVGKYTDKSGEEKWYGLDRIAKLREAALGKAPEGTKIVPPELVGQSVILNLKFNPAPRNDKTGETYGPRTEINGYVKKAR